MYFPTIRRRESEAVAVAGAVSGVGFSIKPTHFSSALLSIPNPNPPTLPKAPRNDPNSPLLGLPMYSDGRDSDAEDGARSCCGCGPRTSRGRGRVAGLGHARVLIWIWPKLLCFLLVVLTHYQVAPPTTHHPPPTMHHAPHTTHHAPPTTDPPLTSAAALPIPRDYSGRTAALRSLVYASAGTGM